jgi:hypothetical protein
VPLPGVAEEEQEHAEGDAHQQDEADAADPEEGLVGLLDDI